MQGLTKTRLWELCSRLVACDTVSTGSNMAAVEYLSETLSAAGFTVVIDPDPTATPAKANVVAWAGPPAPDGLILSGHIDVVPWAGQPGWTRPPLVLTHDEERLYGRGVADMKGFLAQCLALAEELDRGALRRPLVFLFSYDEEVGGAGAARLAAGLTQLLPFPVPREAVIGEPTEWRLLVAHKGHAFFTVETQGIGGHSSRPDQGTSAVVAMLEAIHAIRELERELDATVTDEHRQLFPDYPGTAFNLGMIQGGTAVNMIPERCHLTVGFRPLPGHDAAAIVTRAEASIRRRLRAHCPRAAVSFGKPTIMEPLAVAPPRRVAEVLRTLSGTTEARGAAYATDGGDLQHAGIGCYLFGPGELAQAHQPNESLPIASFLRGVELLRRLVTTICVE